MYSPTVVRYLLGALLMLVPACARAEDGYDLWLRYRPVTDSTRLAEYRALFSRIILPGESATLRVAREELARGLRGLLGSAVTIESTSGSGAIIAGTPATSPYIGRMGLSRELDEAGPEGFVIRRILVRASSGTLASSEMQYLVVAANSDVGVLYGVFHLLRQLENLRPIVQLPVVEHPRVGLRLLNHWDNLDRSVERGYAGLSLWDWASLPDSIPQRYRDYARANASIGINGTVLTNVNANARALTPDHLRKVAALANVFRPYGIKVYLTARFNAPMELGVLTTADPLDSAVRAWWKAKADEIYRLIPDFGGFLVKANSEGQPGPQDYKRTHADGANMLAEAVAPHGGIVMWRAFVYSSEVPVDRIKQAYDEFTPLDGTFLPNVLVQVKNGPLDFQPREPFHPLFGAMPKTPLMMEFQVTKEYLGQDSHLAYLAPLFKEVLDADTWRAGRGSTVAKVVDGSLHGLSRTGIAGVANIGTDRDWTGSQFNQANWYAYGRLAWNPALTSADIADEWIRMTWSRDPAVVTTIRSIMMGSREAVVNYMTPLGLVHIMAEGHHYGPGPWHSRGRPDWTSTYYHRADSTGIGFDRSVTGSNAIEQYAPALRPSFARPDSTDESVLLWFHHVGWDTRMRSGRTLWNELVHRYHGGVDSVRAMQRAWSSLRGTVDNERHAAVDSMLAIQEREARWWRDATLLYFQTFSNRPFPPGYEAPAHPLSFYMNLRCPVDRNRPRCPDIQ